MSAAQGTYHTSHIAECPDVAPECATTAIPAHEHHVRLRLTHTDLLARYGLRPGFAVSLLLPYDVKAQRVRYSTLSGAPYAPPYGDIHHRSETLTGASDGELLLMWAPPQASEWTFAAGTTLPIGRTVPDPIRLGRLGRKHEHLQFGTGVFAPELEAAWSRRWSAVGTSALVRATLPVTTNNHGFRAPRSVRWGVGPSFGIARVQIAVMLAGQYQSVGRWHGEADEGSGFTNGGVRLQLTLPEWRNVTLEPAVYRELYSRGLNEETFSQGMTISLSLRKAF